MLTLLSVGINSQILLSEQILPPYLKHNGNEQLHNMYREEQYLERSLRRGHMPLETIPHLMQPSKGKQIYFLQPSALMLLRVQRHV